MDKKCYAVQMSFDVPDAEKRVAEKASECFEDLGGKLKLTLNHLNILYAPFSKHQGFDSQEVLKHRMVLRKYRDQVKDNFNDIMKRSYGCIRLMGEFSTDTQTTELMNGFMAHVSDLRKQVNRFLGLFSNIGSADFIGSLLLGIDSIKKQINQLKQLINDRILGHIDTNILAKSWTSTITDEYQNKVYEKIPLIIQLFQERQKTVDQA